MIFSPAYSHSVPTIESQTGWRRPSPDALCQDPEVLSKVNQFSFDINNQDFIEYFKSRTGYCLDKVEKPELLHFLLTSIDAEKWLIESPDYRYLNGGMVPFGKERDVAFKINKNTKARLQDTWELFNQGLNVQEKVSA